MNIIISTQNVIMLLSAAMILFVIMALLMLYDYYKNVYLKTIQFQKMYEELLKLLEGENGSDRS